MLNQDLALALLMIMVHMIMRDMMVDMLAVDMVVDTLVVDMLVVVMAAALNHAHSHVKLKHALQKNQ